MRITYRRPNGDFRLIHFLDRMKKTNYMMMLQVFKMKISEKSWSFHPVKQHKIVTASTIHP